jgi:hypothetical protein
MDTWIYRGGRWKVISEKWIATLFLCGTLLAGVAGFSWGMLFMRWRYEARVQVLEQREAAEVSEMQQRISAMETTVDELKSLPPPLQSPNK